MSSGVPHQEFNPRAQQVIHDHSKWVNEWAGTFKPEPHVFGDLLGLVPSGSYSTEGDFATRQQAVDLADLSSSQFCRTHGGYCSVLKPVDFDCSGLPCEEIAVQTTSANSCRGGLAISTWFGVNTTDACVPHC